MSPQPCPDPLPLATSILFLLFLLVTSAILVYKTPTDVILLPAFFLTPVAVLYFAYYRKLRSEIPLDVVVANFACGFLPGSIAVMLVEAVLSVLFFALCFGGQLQVPLAPRVSYLGGLL